MFILMLGDLTAFVSLVFGYFFYWTVHDDFPPDSTAGPGVFWPATAAFLLVTAWALTAGARRWNKRDWTAGFYGSLIVAALLTALGGAALVVGPWVSGLAPKSHVYPATVWILVLWTVVHVGVGLVMQLYCVARRAAGRMTARYDIDIENVALYWHFTVLTVVVTVAVIAIFPMLS
jgi:cytochrome c oxidase subunit I+III